MAESKKIEDIIKDLQESKQKGDREHAKQIDRVLKAINDASNGLVTPERQENKRGGDMYKLSGLPGMQSDAYIITAKGAQSPGAVYSEEAVNNMVSVMAGQIARNGLDVKNSKKKNKKDKLLIGSAVGLLAATVIAAGIGMATTHNNHKGNNIKNDEAYSQVVQPSQDGDEAIENDNLGGQYEEPSLNDEDTQVAEAKQLNYKSFVEQELNLIESAYNSLLANYAALQGSDNMKALDSVVEDLTGYKTMEEYLRHIQSDYRSAKAFCNQNNNDQLENNDAYKELFESLDNQSIFSTVDVIRRVGFDILSKTTHNLGEEFSSFDLEMGE